MIPWELCTATFPLDHQKGFRHTVSIALVLHLIQTKYYSWLWHNLHHLSYLRVIYQVDIIAPDSKLWPNAMSGPADLKMDGREFLMLCQIIFVFNCGYCWTSIQWCICDTMYMLLQRILFKVWSSKFCLQFINHLVYAILLTYSSRTHLLGSIA